MTDRQQASRELVTRLRGGVPKPIELARLLDALSPAERLAAVRALGRAEQRRLYEAVRGFAPLRLQDLVPPATGDRVPVRHYGRNTLPLFTLFEKRFCRPPGADPQSPGSLWGYNHQAMSAFTGPGYFVAREDPAHAEVLIDYREVPPDRPAGWPPLRANDRGLGRLVYGNMVDTLRRVSQHVTIGSAARGGKELGSWFVLCREA